MDVVLMAILIAWQNQDVNKVAAQKATEAYLKQSGIEKTVNDFYQRKASDNLKASLTASTFILKTITEQKIIYEVTF